MLKITHDPEVGKPAEPEDLVIDLDELCCMAAKQMLALALEAERQAYLEATPRCAMRPGVAWWWATAPPAPER